MNLAELTEVPRLLVEMAIVFTIWYRTHQLEKTIATGIRTNGDTITGADLMKRLDRIQRQTNDAEIEVDKMLGQMKSIRARMNRQEREDKKEPEGLDNLTLGDFLSNQAQAVAQATDSPQTPKMPYRG